MVGGGLRLGQMVESIAGRDRGKRYIVVQLVNSQFCLVANGRERTVARPKSKNRRHLLVHDAVDTELEAKLAEGEPVTDEQLDQALRAQGV